MNKAYKMFDDPEQMEFLKGAVEEAQGMTELKVKEKRKLAAKQGQTTIDEDDPDKVGRSVWGVSLLSSLCAFSTSRCFTTH